jgi:putative membrane protein insertion efficiency factor
MRRVLIALIRVYQWGIAPLRVLLPGPAGCRFYPSCSEYAAQAIAQHGAPRGVRLAGRRLLRCHPWHDGGVDPVPER